MKTEIKKVVLAYSGGLDTSIIIPWLKENYNDPEIIAVSADVGQGDELEGLEEKALKTGASKLYVEDLTDEMVDEVVVPSMMMGAKYEDYLLGTAFISCTSSPHPCLHNDVPTIIHPSRHPEAFSLLRIRHIFSY